MAKPRPSTYGLGRWDYDTPPQDLRQSVRVIFRRGEFPQEFNDDRLGRLLTLDGFAFGSFVNPK